MPNEHLNHILTINSGSSSIKFSLYHMGRFETMVLAGEIERIGRRSSLFHARNSDGRILIEKCFDMPDHSEALKVLFDWLKSNDYDHDLNAVGHRVVHGGTGYSEPQLVTRELLAELRILSPYVPEHLPHELDAIEAVGMIYPEVKQVACFDTAFHREMPRVAQLYALPRHLSDEGIIRYGFHGLSYEYIAEELAKVAGEDIAYNRIIIAHLGHGASMTAVYSRQAVDTTMGFSPSGGLVMSTRSGDLDPAVILYLIKHKGMTVDQVNEIVNRKSGLLGVSGTSADMKDMLEREPDDPQAKEAVELFCYQAKKFMGGLAAVLGGLDTLIFTGGIGENSSAVRGRICEGLEFLGIYLDAERNRTHAPVISRSDSQIVVRVMKTNEELMIVRHTQKLLCRGKVLN